MLRCYNLNIPHWESDRSPSYSRTQHLALQRKVQPELQPNGDFCHNRSDNFPSRISITDCTIVVFSVLLVLFIIDIYYLCRCVDSQCEQTLTLDRSISQDDRNEILSGKKGGGADAVFKLGVGCLYMTYYISHIIFSPTHEPVLNGEFLFTLSLFDQIQSMI